MEDKLTILINDPQCYINEYLYTFERKIDLYFENKKLKYPDDIKTINKQHVDVIKNMRGQFSAEGFKEFMAANSDLLTPDNFDDLVSVLLMCNKITFNERREYFDRTMNIPVLTRVIARYLYNECSIDANNCSIKSIESHALVNTLQSLELNGNLMQVLKTNMFEGLVHLCYLNLSNNKISTIEQDAFKDLDKLKTLYLNGNQLSHLSLTTFDHVYNLETLGLANCNIKTIEPSLFDKFNNLTELRLEHNPKLDKNIKVKVFGMSIEELIQEYRLAEERFYMIP